MLPFVTTRMSLEGTVVSEKLRERKKKLNALIYMWKIKNLNHPGNCVLYSVITSMAKESEKEWIHVYI